MNIVKRFLRDETAATAIEYGLIAAGISLAIISAVRGLGTNLGSKFTSINTSLKWAPSRNAMVSRRTRCLR